MTLSESIKLPQGAVSVPCFSFEEGLPLIKEEDLRVLQTAAASLKSVYAGNEKIFPKQVSPPNHQNTFIVTNNTAENTPINNSTPDLPNDLCSIVCSYLIPEDKNDLKKVIHGVCYIGAYSSHHSVHLRAEFIDGFVSMKGLLKFFNHPAPQFAVTLAHTTYHITHPIHYSPPGVTALSLMSEINRVHHPDRRLLVEDESPLLKLIVNDFPHPLATSAHSPAQESRVDADIKDTDYSEVSRYRIRGE